MVGGRSYGRRTGRRIGQATRNRSLTWSANVLLSGKQMRRSSGVRTPRVDTPHCFAATAQGAEVLEQHLVEVFNVAVADVQLPAGVRRYYALMRRHPCEAADWYAVEERMDGATRYYPVLYQYRREDTSFKMQFVGTTMNFIAMLQRGKEFVVECGHDMSRRWEARQPAAAADDEDEAAMDDSEDGAASCSDSDCDSEDSKDEAAMDDSEDGAASCGDSDCDSEDSEDEAAMDDSEDGAASCSDSGCDSEDSEDDDGGRQFNSGERFSLPWSTFPADARAEEKAAMLQLVALIQSGKACSLPESFCLPVRGAPSPPPLLMPADTPAALQPVWHLLTDKLVGREEKLAAPSFFQLRRDAMCAQRAEALQQLLASQGIRCVVSGTEAKSRGLWIDASSVRSSAVMLQQLLARRRAAFEPALLAHQLGEVLGEELLHATVLSPEHRDSLERLQQLLLAMDAHARTQLVIDCSAAAAGGGADAAAAAPPGGGPAGAAAPAGGAMAGAAAGACSLDDFLLEELLLLFDKALCALAQLELNTAYDASVAAGVAQPGAVPPAHARPARDSLAGCSADQLTPHNPPPHVAELLGGQGPFVFLQLERDTGRGFRTSYKYAGASYAGGLAQVASYTQILCQVGLSRASSSSGGSSSADGSSTSSAKIGSLYISTPVDLVVMDQLGRSDHGVSVSRLPLSQRRSSHAAVAASAVLLDDAGAAVTQLLIPAKQQSQLSLLEQMLGRIGSRVWALGLQLHMAAAGLAKRAPLGGQATLGSFISGSREMSPEQWLHRLRADVTAVAEGATAPTEAGVASSSSSSSSSAAAAAATTAAAAAASAATTAAAAGVPGAPPDAAAAAAAGVPGAPPDAAAAAAAATSALGLLQCPLAYLTGSPFSSVCMLRTRVAKGGVVTAMRDGEELKLGRAFGRWRNVYAGASTASMQDYSRWSTALTAFEEAVRPFVTDSVRVTMRKDGLAWLAARDAAAPLAWALPGLPYADPHAPGLPTWVQLLEERLQVQRNRGKEAAAALVSAYEVAARELGQILPSAANQVPATIHTILRSRLLAYGADSSVSSGGSGSGGGSKTMLAELDLPPNGSPAAAAAAAAAGEAVPPGRQLRKRPQQQQEQGPAPKRRTSRGAAAGVGSGW